MIIMRNCHELVDNYGTYLLMVLFQTSLVNSLCQSFPSLRCCPDSVWDNEQNKCVGCQTGYLGPNCAKVCSPPNYGKRCQFTCTCKGAETCHPSFGCALPTTTIIIPTTATSVQTTTEENIESTRNTGTTKFGIRASLVARETSVTTNVAIDIIFTSSLQNQKFMETINLNDTSYIDTSILLGIFMLCGLFVVLFAVFVGTQIRNKCFKRNNSTSRSPYGLYLKPYNLNNADQSLEAENLSQAEEASEQNRTWPKYIEVVASPKNSTCCDPGAEFSLTTYVPMT